MSVQLSASESVLLASSVLGVGVKIPVHVTLSEESTVICVVSVPLALVSEMSEALEKLSTGSEKTSLTVAVSPYKSFVSEIVKLTTEGRISSTI